MDRPGPAWGLALCTFVEVFRDGQGRDYTTMNTPADLAPLFPPKFLEEAIDRVEVRRSVSPKREQRVSPKLGYPG